MAVEDMGCRLVWNRIVCLVSAPFIAPIVAFGFLGTHRSEAATILVYHRFGFVAADNMTVTTRVFEQQLDWLSAHGQRIVPLRTLLAGLEAKSPTPDLSTVAITVDDGHETVFTEMLPVVERRKIPVTLFVYPSAISNASYAMTWAQLAIMVETGFVDVQSHSYWHPNFKTEAARLDRDAYEKFVEMQLIRSRESIAAHLKLPVDLLAWPFGIHDADLEDAARRCGYVGAFTLELRAVRSDDDLFALPRYLVTDRDRGPRFGTIFNDQKPK